MAFGVGLSLRNSLWHSSEYSLRNPGDLHNAWHYGQVILELARTDLLQHGKPADPISWRDFFRAYRHAYDGIAANVTDGNYQLDYPPLRLLVVSTWVKHIYDLNPTAKRCRDDFVGPILIFNTICALAAAITAGVLVSRAIRLDSPGYLVETRAVLSGLGAALLIWLNPAILLDAHAWPQWDVWPIPFFLLAVLFLTLDCGMIAGSLLVIGAMLKGQLLLVAPLMLIWPLLTGHITMALKVFAGGAATTALITSIWLLPDTIDWITLGVILAIALVSCLWIFRRLMNFDIKSLLNIPAVILAITFSATVFFIGWAFGGSWTWLSMGFGYGMRRTDTLQGGITYNLATILAQKFGLKLHDVVRVPLPLYNFGVELKSLLAVVYVVLLILCAIAAALASRRNDPRLYVALTAPFVLFYAILGQMHGRYLLFGAAISGICVAAGRWATVLSIFTTVLATLPILHTELLAHPNFDPVLLRSLMAAQFYLSLATLFIAGAYLWIILQIIIPAYANRICTLLRSLLDKIGV